jgi:large subunit ribosomal protein L23
VPKERIILIRPLLTEKSTDAKDKLNHVAFEVDPGANKLQIQKAVEKRFNVKVTGVRTMNFMGKLKRQGRFEGRRKSWKKAVVMLAEGQKIEFFENQ